MSSAERPILWLKSVSPAWSGFQQGLGTSTVVNAEVDVRSMRDVRQSVVAVQPKAIVYAGLRDIKSAEQDPNVAFGYLGEGPIAVAAAALEMNALAVFISHPAVFAGGQGKWTEADTPQPGSAYGDALLRGETFLQRAAASCHLIVRAGPVVERRPCGIDMPINSLSRRRMSPVTDLDLGRLVRQLVEADARGVIHAAGEHVEERTLYEWLQAQGGGMPAGEAHASEEPWGLRSHRLQEFGLKPPSPFWRVSDPTPRSGAQDRSRPRRVSVSQTPAPQPDSGRAAWFGTQAPLSWLPSTTSESILQVLEQFRRHPIKHQFTEAALDAWMSHHVWALWGEITRIRAVFSGLMGHGQGWRPPQQPALYHLTFMMLQAEERIPIAPGHSISHIEYFLSAMAEAGGQTLPVTQFFEQMGQLEPMSSVADAWVPALSRDLVQHSLALSAEPIEIQLITVLFSLNVFRPLLGSIWLNQISLSSNRLRLVSYLQMCVRGAAHWDETEGLAAKDEIQFSDQVVSRSSDLILRELETKMKVLDRIVQNNKDAL